MAECGLPRFLTLIKEHIDQKFESGEIGGNGDSEARIEELENRVAELESQLVENSSLPKVMFQAYRRIDASEESGGPPSNFEQITINHGDAFDGSTFTAPVAGVYTFSIVAHSKYAGWVRIGQVSH